MCKKMMCLVWFVFMVSQTVMAGEVARWDFEETGGTTTTEAQGSSVATLLGSASLDIAGKFGSGLDCAGDGGAIIDSAGTAAVTFPGDFTVAIWVNPDTAPVAFTRFVEYSSGSGGLQNGYRLMTLNNANSDNFRFMARGNGNTSIHHTRDLAVDTWNLLVARYDADGDATVNVLQDGDVVDASFMAENNITKASKGPVSYAETNVHIGQSTTGHFFDGQIDGAVFFDEVLTDAQVADIFNAAPPKPLEAFDPKPSNNGEVDVDAADAVVLQWQAGEGAVSHSVYYGTDPDALTLVSDSKPGTTFAITEKVVPDNIYFWRIDENLAGGEVVTGNLWSFSMADHVTVEDFEIYEVEDATDTPENLFAAWFVNLDSAALMGLNRELADSGKQSMLLIYDNDGEIEFGGETLQVQMFSEVYYPLTPAQDWTRNALAAFAVSVRGEPNNVLAQSDNLYMTISDAGGKSVTLTYNGQPDDLKTAAWSRWDIDLTTLSPADVDLTQVAQIALGIGSPDNPQAGGQGTIHLDALRLHLRRCVPEVSLSQGDINGDCIVDAADLAIIAENWMMGEYTVYPQEPNNTLVAYNFDETSGSVAADSSGNGHDGVVSSSIDWDPDGASGGCLNFDGTFNVEVPAAAFADVNESYTISCWIKGNPDSQPQSNTNFHAITETENNLLDIGIPYGGGQVTVFKSIRNGAEFNANVGTAKSVYAGEWAHFLFMRNGDTEEMLQYQNGVRRGRRFPTKNGLAGITGFYIGSKLDGSRGYHGRMDEIRIYDYALDLSGILGLSNSEPLFVPLTDPGDVNGDGIIDQADKDIVEANQGQEILWP